MLGPFRIYSSIVFVGKYFICVSYASSDFNYSGPYYYYLCSSTLQFHFYDIHNFTIRTILSTDGWSGSQSLELGEGRKKIYHVFFNHNELVNVRWAMFVLFFTNHSPTLQLSDSQNLTKDNKSQRSLSTDGVNSLGEVSILLGLLHGLLGSLKIRNQSKKVEMLMINWLQE